MLASPSALLFRSHITGEASGRTRHERHQTCRYETLMVAALPRGRREPGDLLVGEVVGRGSVSPVPVQFAWCSRLFKTDPSDASAAAAAVAAAAAPPLAGAGLQNHITLPSAALSFNPSPQLPPAPRAWPSPRKQPRRKSEQLHLLVSSNVNAAN